MPLTIGLDQFTVAGELLGFMPMPGQREDDDLAALAQLAHRRAQRAVLAPGRADRGHRSLRRGRLRQRLDVQAEPHGRSVAAEHRADFVVAAAAAVRAPWGEDGELRAAVRRLREQGQMVVCTLPGHEHEAQEYDCDRELIEVDGQWVLRAL